MTTLEIQISDSVIAYYGKNALIDKFHRFLELEEWHLSALKIQSAITEAGLDQDTIWKEAKATAWAEFKSQTPLGIL
jgi:hypothetical protein